MLKIIFVALMTFLSAVGLCDLLHSLWEIFLFPKSNPKHIHITFLDGKNDYSILLWLSDHIRWFGKRAAKEFYVVKSAKSDIEIMDSFDNSLFSIIDIQDFQNFGEEYEQ